MSIKLIIIGAGFAGLRTAKYLRNTDYDITLIDTNNFHQFQPLFYQVATSFLEPASISFPLRKIFQQASNVQVRLGPVKYVDTVAKKVLTLNDEYAYDELIIATGCKNNYFGNENIETYAFPMKSTPQAIALRNKILLNFEEALACNSEEEKKAYMNIVVVGGGPTGVELAGALAEMKKNILPKDYHSTDFSKLEIYLIEGSAHTLSNMSKNAQEYSQKYLEELGVKVVLNAFVKDYDGKMLIYGDDRQLLTKTLIWAAGVTGNVPDGIGKEFLGKGNRLIVDEYHRVKNLEGVYAIGDVSLMQNEAFPNGHPQLANVANNQAKNLAKNLKNRLKGKPERKFFYKDPGTMATVGKLKAVVDLPNWQFQGVFAWFVWMFLHLMLILSVRNKLIIFINWMISYFSNDSSLRLIFLPSEKEKKLGEKYKCE